MCKRHFLAVNSGRIFLGDEVPVRVDFGVAENGGDPIFETLRDEVFQPLGLVMDLVPGILQNVMQEEFQEAVMPHQFPRPPFPRGRKPDTSVLLVRNECGPLRCESLKHSGHRGRSNFQPLGKSVRCDAQFLGTAQFEDGF